MSRRKKYNKEEKIDSNLEAIINGPDKKHWTIHDLKVIKPLTNTQNELFSNFLNNDTSIVAAGTAGTGKTYLAFYLAFNELLQQNTIYKKIIIVRSAVTTRDIGFMPGNIDDKMSLYETPYRDICGNLFNRNSTYDDMKKAGKIVFMPSSYLRGLTWNDCIVIVEEIQNMTYHEINSCMTRIGKNTRVFITGDGVQTDLTKNSREVTGIYKFLSIAEKMRSFHVLYFNTNDIVRSDFVKEWIIASEDFDNGRQ